jgi:3,4-dihydroxy 2-butanone 4-phosphate synthase/GTP cyclohydrolase II
MSPACTAKFMLRRLSSRRPTDDVHLALVLGKITPESRRPGAGARAAVVLDFLDFPREPPQFQHRPRIEARLPSAAAASSCCCAAPDRVRKYWRRWARPRPPRPAAKWDPRLYGIGAQILRDLGVRRMKLLVQPAQDAEHGGFQLDVTGYI